jgi:hypothetical protein
MAQLLAAHQCSARAPSNQPSRAHASCRGVRRVRLDVVDGFHKLSAFHMRRNSRSTCRHM